MTDQDTDQETRRERWTGPSLSPSRAQDFLRCPLMYRFRTVDRLPEPSSTAALRGTLVHRVLERLFDLAADRRDLPAARALVLPSWRELLERDPTVEAALGDDRSLGRWMLSADALLARYFALEDPREAGDPDRELFVETDLPSGLRLRGVVDRLDEAPTGELRVVDYKTGRSPGERYEGRALFQMRFYALVVWRTRGVVPTLQLMYLGDGEVLRYTPDEAELLATERKVDAIWAAIAEARRTGDFRPSPGRVCDWCAHHDLCPAKGGVLPPMPEAADPSPSSPGPQPSGPTPTPPG